MLIENFNKLTIWGRNGERAPHKPLLILFALGEFFRNPNRMIPYSEVDKKLRELLEEFGPNRKSYRPDYSFWRLQKDGIWEVHGADTIELTNSGDARKRDLVNGNVSGSFPENVRTELSRNPKLFSQIVQNILNAHFPTTIHEDILQSVGIDLSIKQQAKRKRSSDFRQKILQAYEYRCAICGVDIRLGHARI